MPDLGSNTHCGRTGTFQIVFTETRLEPELHVEVGRQGDEEWHAAIRLLLGTLSAARVGVTASNSSWQELIMWLHAGECLETFIQRSLQSIDAAVWLLSRAVDESAEHGYDPLDRLQRLASAQPVCD